MKNTNIKTIFNALLLLSAVIGTSPKLAGQNCSSPPNCLVNPNLTAGAGGELNNGAPMTGWFRSHGTPNVQIGQGHGGSNAIWMWSYQSSIGINQGEGIFACYNFQQGKTYRICLWVMNTNSVTGGTLNVRAANNMNQPGTGTFTIPNPGSQQLISNSYTHSSAWTQLTLVYTPNANYSQLWIYPHYPVYPAGGPQYELRVSKINVFEIPPLQSYVVPCEGSLFIPGSSSPCTETKWYAPDGSYLGDRDLVIENALSVHSGTYTMVINSGDCSVSLPVEITVKCNCDEVEVNFNANTSGNPVQFTETTTGPGISVGWYWDFGNGSTSNSQNPSHHYSQPGVYEVCLTVIRKVGDQTCCVRYCKNVSVGMPPPGTFAKPIGFSSSPIFESLNAVQFNSNVKSKNAFKEYHWDFGDGSVSCQENPTHVYAQSGVYQVCLKITDYHYDEEGELIETTQQEKCEVTEVRAESGDWYDRSVGMVTVSPNPTSNQAVVRVENLPNARVSLYSIEGEQLAEGVRMEEGIFLIRMDQLAAGVYLVRVRSDRGTQTLRLLKE